MANAWNKALADQRHALEFIETKRAASAMKRIYDRAQDELVGKLAKLLKVGKQDSFTAYQHQQALAAIRVGQIELVKLLKGEMHEQTVKAHKAALTRLGRSIAVLEKKYSGAEFSMPVAEVAQLSGATQKRERSLLRIHAESINRYGIRNIERMEAQIAVSLAQGESPAEAVDRVAEIADEDWAWGERIVRTEMSYAHNSAIFDGVAAAAQELPGLMLRWSEHCADDGTPLDNRVAVDSIAMHGQVTSVGGMFVMPPVAPVPDFQGRQEVPDKLVGKAWQFPPNRPNDRSVIQPWREDWQIPGWRYAGGGRDWIVNP